MGGNWAWFGKYSDKLLNLFKSLNIAPKQSKPLKPWVAREEKHVNEASQLGEGHGNGVKEDQAKQQYSSNIVEAPVNPWPRPLSSHLAVPPSTLNQQAFLHAHPPQTMSASPLSHNPFATLATQAVPCLQQLQFPSPFQSYYYPQAYYYPQNTPLTDSPQPLNCLFYSY